MIVSPDRDRLVYRDRLKNLPAGLTIDRSELLLSDDLTGGIAIGIEGVMTGQTSVVGLLHRIDCGLAESLSTSGIARVLWYLSATGNRGFDRLDQNFGAIIASSAICTQLAIGSGVVLNEASSRRIFRHIGRGHCSIDWSAGKAN